MKTEELADAMHRTDVPSMPDIDRIVRRGRRLVRRRRAVGAGVALGGSIVLAVPLMALHREPHHALPPATGVSAMFAQASPIGAVEETGSKFYWGTDRHSGSLGPEAIWVEAGDAPYLVSFGFRDERTGGTRWAGEVAVPSTTGTRVALPPIPHQHGEPTYVGMYRLPAGTDADRYSVVVEGPGRRNVEVAQSGRVLPGYLVFWVTASQELGTSTYAVEDARGEHLVTGGFRPPVD